MTTLKMGTRGSALARAQSQQLVDQLCARVPGLSVETVIITTSGDRFAAANPEAAPVQAEGTKGLFVKEIEEALLAGTIDFAVHSAKDLPAALAPGLAIAAYPERADPRDVLIARGGADLQSLPKGAKVASSSLRRQIQLKRARPDLEFISMRGNVDTRLRKLEQGVCDALVLARAGLKRLGREPKTAFVLAPELVVPAPGQGALAVEIREGDEKTRALIAKLDHAATRAEVELERAFLATLGGGCSTPMGAFARSTDAGLDLLVFWSRADGSGAARADGRCAPGKGAELVASLAARVRS